MKKVLFATSNPAKVDRFKDKLAAKGIELVSLLDMDEKIDIVENGNNSIENAKIKARACYEKYNITTIGMDDSLFIDGIEEDKQPGTHVRRVNGKTLDDEEMISYYSGLVKEHGESLVSRWVYGLAICSDKGEFVYTWSKDDFYFVSTPSKNRTKGYPLNSISFIPELNKYLVDLTPEEREIIKKNDILKDDLAVEFIANNV